MCKADLTHILDHDHSSLYSIVLLCSLQQSLSSYACWSNKEANQDAFYLSTVSSHRNVSHRKQRAHLWMNRLIGTSQSCSTRTLQWSCLLRDIFFRREVCITLDLHTNYISCGWSLLSYRRMRSGEPAKVWGCLRYCRSYFYGSHTLFTKTFQFLEKAKIHKKYQKGYLTRW